MSRILYLCIFLLLVPMVQAEVMNKPQKEGRKRLVCMYPDALVEHVKRLTWAQLRFVHHAASNGQIKWPCDDVQLPSGTVVVHERWLQTKDGFYVIAQTIQYPNRSAWVTVDPLQFTYHIQPIEFQRYYPDYFVPIIPGGEGDYAHLYDPATPGDVRHHSHTSPPRDSTGDRRMDVKEGQEDLKRQLRQYRESLK